MGKKKNAWQCRCDYECNSWDGMFAHIRREHPEHGYWAWDINEDLGNEFANGAMRELRDDLRGHNKELQDRLAVAEPKAKAYEELVERYNALGRAINHFEMAMVSYRAAYEKTKP